MLEAPNLPPDLLAGFVQRAYGLSVRQIDFLPLGADVNTAVFRVCAGDGCYFLKLRSGAFAEASVALPALLVAQGNAHVVPVVPTITGEWHSSIEPFTTILYPFVEGRDGFSVRLSPAQWHDLGAAFRHLHAAEVPAGLLERIPAERYSPIARDAVLAALEAADAMDAVTAKDAITRDVVALLRDQRTIIIDLVARAGRLARALQSQPPAFVVCHGDIHAGNILIDNDDRLFVVDWDTLARAPKERDLMYFGGGQGFVGYTAEEERALFFAGYGDCAINEDALAYYRYERIVQDIYAFCNELLSSEGDGDDRRQSLKWLAGNFAAGGVIDVAYAADRSQETGQV